MVGRHDTNYTGEVTTYSNSWNACVKVLVNSGVSTRNATFTKMDILNVYLNTPRKHLEYICTKITEVPDEVIKEYQAR